MIMPDEDYGMDHVAHSSDDENHVQELHLMVLNYGRYNNVRIIELLGALELVKYRIACGTYAEDEGQ